jgi:hypothetical protein
MFAFLVLLSCSTAYNLADRDGNVFIIEKPELKNKKKLEFRAGVAVRELAIKDIVSISIQNAEHQIFNGMVFYPATLSLEDTISVPKQGFIYIEDTLIAKNAGSKFSIPLADIKEFSRVKKE